jgi:hypothetical protein
VFVNFCRLTDKALMEYEAARKDLGRYVAGAGSSLPYLRAIDHFETCIDAAQRAVRYRKELRALIVGRGAPVPTAIQDKRLKEIGDAVGHTDDRLLKASSAPHRPPIKPGQAFALFPTNTRVIIGDHALTYRQLASVITKCHPLTYSM